ncbi:MAG: phosphatase PAP2 family protein [Anaerolineae bacterium]|nr:phosphatase PAP2 family protein [Anaerolineae bacterium]
MRSLSSELLRALLLVLVALAVMLPVGLWVRGRAVDQQVLRWINTGLADPVFDLLAVLGFILGSVWFVLALGVAFFLLGRRRLGVSLFLANLSAALIVAGLKLLLNEPRPWEVLTGIRVVGQPLVGQGYPSSHAVVAFLTAYLLIRYYSPGWPIKVLLYGLATLVALSRVYDGEHFPTDVLVGALIGLLFGYLWTRLWPWLEARAGRRGEPG